MRQAQAGRVWARLLHLFQVEVQNFIRNLSSTETKITQHLGCHTATDFLFTSLQSSKKGVVIWEETVFQKAKVFCPQKHSTSNSTSNIAFCSIAPEGNGPGEQHSTTNPQHSRCPREVVDPLLDRQVVQSHTPWVCTKTYCT